MENRIIADLKDSYGLTCNQITPVAGGWLNQKWKVSTDKYDLLVKQFSNKRCSREKLMLIESALQRQIILKKNGVLCPSIWAMRRACHSSVGSRNGLYGDGFPLGKN